MILFRFMLKFFIHLNMGFLCLSSGVTCLSITDIARSDMMKLEAKNEHTETNDLKH